MRIPVLLMGLELQGGGSERQLAEVALGLDRSQFEPYVAALRPGGLRETELWSAGVPVTPLGVRSFRSAGALAGVWNLARFIRARRIRLVHAFDAPSSVFATPVVRALTSAVMLTSQRGHRELTPEYRKLLRWTDRRAHGIVVNCEYLRQYLVREEHVPDSLIHVCRNGIDLQKFHPARAARPDNLPPDAFVIGVVSMLRPEKDLATLIRAFALLHPRESRLKLAIVGSGPELESLQQCAQDSGVAHDVVFQPATADVAAWLRNFDVFVLPSRNEAFPNALMEAMACGCPVVASNVGGIPELIESGSTGLLFEPGDAVALAAALHRLIQNPRERSALAAAGERFVRENLSRQASVQRMAEIYAAAIRNRSSGPRR